MIFVRLSYRALSRKKNPKKTCLANKMLKLDFSVCVAMNVDVRTYNKASLNRPTIGSTIKGPFREIVGLQS